MPNISNDDSESTDQIQEIWNSDLFDRSVEAMQLIAYIESAVDRRWQREDKKAYTIAVDAPYGEGKTFFLKRLAKQLAINHPVAFVDAWADDLADEPLTALVATLKDALTNQFDNQAVNNGLNKVIRQSGKVLKIAGKGLAWRLVGLGVGMGSAEAIRDVVSGASDELVNATGEALAVAGQGAGEDLANATFQEPSELMRKRLNEFEEGKRAINDLKDGLRTIIEALDHSMIVIVIDELDRCRPNYAIKLLEEIKHLFDVHGLIFILGTHSNQLGYSISGAYGSKFDGHSYLRRFIDRHYRLKSPNILMLISHLCQQHSINDQKFVNPNAQRDEAQNNIEFHQLICEYMYAYNLTARDSYRLIDIMQTASSLVPANQSIYLPYFLPLAIGQITGEDFGIIPIPKNEIKWKYKFFNYRLSSSTEYNPIDLAKHIQDATRLSRRDLIISANEPEPSIPVQIVSGDMGTMSNNARLGTITTIPELLRTVGRFNNSTL